MSPATAAAGASVGVAERYCTICVVEGVVGRPLHFVDITAGQAMEVLTALGGDRRGEGN